MNCFNIVEVMGYTWSDGRLYAEGISPPWPGTYKFSEDGASFTWCSSPPEQSITGGAKELYVWLQYGTARDELPPDINEAADAEVNSLRDEEDVSGVDVRRVRCSAEYNHYPRELIDARLIGQLIKDDVKGEYCPLCAGAVHVESSSIYCDWFTCPSCGNTGTVADWLAQQMYRRPYHKLKPAEAQTLHQAQEKVPRQNHQNHHGSVVYINDSANGIRVRNNPSALAAEYVYRFPCVYSEQTKSFYRYSDEIGKWCLTSDKQIEKELLNLYKRALKDCLPTGELIDKYMCSINDRFFKGVIEQVKAEAQGDVPFGVRRYIIPVANGVLELKDGAFVLKECFPGYFLRNRSEFAFNPQAKCPKFCKELLDAALSPEDQIALQKYVGQCLLGRNLTQTFLILSGTSGGGKGTILAIIEVLVGVGNCLQLRTNHLLERFEAAFMRDKSLLTGKDVTSCFLNMQSASVIKALIGGDRLSGEAKGSNVAFQLEGTFNLIICTNPHLKIRLDSDRDAWARRMIILDFNQPPVEKGISDLADVLVREEGEGILAWGVEGARMVLADAADNGRFHLTEGQRCRVRNLLDESDSIAAFVKEKLEPSAIESVTAQELFRAYSDYCAIKGWAEATEMIFYREVKKLISQYHNILSRHDLGGARGYHGLRIKTDGVQIPCDMDVVANLHRVLGLNSDGQLAHEDPLSPECAMPFTEDDVPSPEGVHPEIKPDSAKGEHPSDAL